MDKGLTNDSGCDTLMDEWVTGTQLFQQWNAMKREILLHKWYQSEKAGHDVGWERAATNWMIHYGQKFQYRGTAKVAEQA